MLLISYYAEVINDEKNCFSIIGLFTDNHQFIDNLALITIGFFIYGPIMLIGVQALDLSPKNAAGTSAGLTGFFGYFFGTAILANSLLGYLIQADTTWEAYFVAIMASCIAAILLMIFISRKEYNLERDAAKK